MKLKFSSNLPYQELAINSVIDLFEGQSLAQSYFTVTAYDEIIGTRQTENGIGNRLELDEDTIFENLQKVQLRNGLEPSPNLVKNKDQIIKYDFDIEMETGTGKTYVYIRTMLEMNQKYGFTKFIIVVPGLAIKEGVYKSLLITREHFKSLYDNIAYNFFIYDSSKPEDIRGFAVDTHISIMVINIDAFRKNIEENVENNIAQEQNATQKKKIDKKSNIIHRVYDKFNGMKPIELIQETNPFVIIDEPQTTDTTEKSKKAISSLNPLCIFRYSATHVEKHNLIYCLNAVDSYNMKLVKQIEVASFASIDNHNKAYFMLKSVNNNKTPITAKLIIDVKETNAIKRKSITIKMGDDLFEKSMGRDLYEGYIVDEIFCEKGSEYISFASKPEILRLNEVFGDIDDIVIKEAQIRKTIEEHLDKERQLNAKGIKVLSLFFIDRVANYRTYAENGQPQKGIYAKIFERNYLELIKKPKYNTLMYQMNESDINFDTLHDGYFSIDKQKKTLKDTTGETKADNETYNLIMRDKEKLLSFDNDLRFIFSHSALKEGWDNPNVFQVCTLNETKSVVKKRQEIGRGLRLSVNQEGERQHADFNVLTVMANESYQDYAARLQNEYEKDQGIKFGYVEKHSFANIPVSDKHGEIEYLGMQKSEEIYNFLLDKSYIDLTGKVKEGMKLALKNDNLQLPDDISDDIRPFIVAMCEKVSSNIKISNADDKKTITLTKGVFESAIFEELWELIKWKTTYAVDFDSTKLIDSCIIKFKRDLIISAPKLRYTKADLEISIGGVEANESVDTTVAHTRDADMFPDIVTYLQHKTHLTRKTIVEILVQSHTLDSFKKNPQKYMEESAKIIRIQMQKLITDGIKYTRLGDEEFYAQELFLSEELAGYFKTNLMPSEKSIYSHVIYDSNNELGFAEKFERNPAVKLYIKLPSWFKIPTPLGSYNPDWAVLVENDNEKKLYFVVESKGMIGTNRNTEEAKIDCGHEHFKSLGNGISFSVADDVDKFLLKYL